MSDRLLPAIERADDELDADPRTADLAGTTHREPDRESRGDDAPAPGLWRPALNGTDATTIGVDLGVRNLFAAAPAASEPAIPNAISVEGAVCRALVRECVAVVRRLGVEADETDREQRAVVGWYHDRLMERFDAAADRLLTYLDGFERPIRVVMEDFDFQRRPLRRHVRDERDAGSWILPTFRYRLGAHLERAGRVVSYVDPESTTRRCHECGQPGEVDRSFMCSNEDCPVDEVCRDESAAVAIARRGRGEL